MQVSPVDIQAWASETGSDYPATPAEKAAVLPAVAAWKQEQLADAKASRGQNAISPLAVGLGAGGLGLAGLVAFSHFRKQGLSEPAAAQKAKDLQAQVEAVAPTPAAPNLRAIDPASQAIRNRVPARSGTVYDGPVLRNDAPNAATLETRGGRNMGSTLARDQGQYKARSEKGFHDPAVASLVTPEQRSVYLAAVADAHGTVSPEFKRAESVIAAMEASTPVGVSPTSFLAQSDPTTGNSKPFGGKERYGTTTAQEESDNGGFLAQSRTKSNTSAQAGFQSRETAVQSTGKPGNASVFYQDSDGSLKPYQGSAKLLDEDGQPLLNKRGQTLYTGRRADGSPIAESDLAYFPTDDPDFYARSGLSHPELKAFQVAMNAGDLPDRRFATEEDQSIKGMVESLGPSDPRFSDGVRRGGVSDNWAIGSNGAGERVPLDISGFQSEMGSPGPVAGAALKGRLQAHRAATGQVPPTAVVDAWTADLARQYGVDVNTVARAATGQAAPPPQRLQNATAHALGGGSSADQLDRVYNSLGMHAGADAWNLEGMVRSGDIKGAAAALASQLPALTSVNAGGLRGTSQDEKLNIVAEGVSAGLKDLAVTLEKYPQAAEKFGIGKGAGGFGIDAYLKSYVRDWVTVRGLQLDPTGQPTYQVPNDAFEILAYQAHQAGHSTLTEIQHHVRGASNGLEGALRLDRLVSAAQSTKEADPNSNATNFAQQVFDLKDPDLVSTSLTQEAAGDVKLSFGTRRDYDATAGFYDRNPNEAQLDDALESYTQFTYSRNADSIDGERFPESRREALANSGYNIQPRGDVAGYSENKTLSARKSGGDTNTEEGRAQRQAAEQTQAWIKANAGLLEQERADLNRGIVASATPDDSLIAARLPARASADDAHRLAAERGLTPRQLQTPDGPQWGLFHPSDTPQSHGRGFVITANERGALLAADTQGLNTSIREEQFNDLDTTPVDRAQDNEREALLNNQVPEPEGVDASDARSLVPVTEAEATARQYGSTKLHFKNLGQNSRGAMAPGEAAGPLSSLRRLIEDQKFYRQVAANHDAAFPSSWSPPAGIGFEIGASEPIRGIGPQPEPPATPVTFARTPQREPSVPTRPQGIPDGAVDPYQSWYRPAATRVGTVYGEKPITLQGGEVVNIPTIALHGTWNHRKTHPRQPLSAEQIFSLVDQRPRSAVQPEANTATAALHRAAVEARGVGRGEVFRDDQQLREASDRTLMDRGEVSGLGRRGSTFTQAPIAAAPVSSVPAAAREQLNTLRSSLERPVTAAYSTQELDDARARHIMSYIESAATPSFDKAGRQTRGWTGGDSYQGGAHLAGRADRNVGAYNAPSGAMLNALALAARRRAGAS